MQQQRQRRGTTRNDSAGKGGEESRGLKAKESSMSEVRRVCCLVTDMCWLLHGVDQGDVLQTVSGVVMGMAALRSSRRQMRLTFIIHLLLQGALFGWSRHSHKQGLPQVSHERRQMRPALIGSQLGFDDEEIVGWEPNLDVLTKAEIRARHLTLVADTELATKHREEGAPNALCWRSPEKLRCVPTVYLLGSPKCGTSDLWEKLSVHPDVSRARRKETRFFTRGEFGPPREGYLDEGTSLELFAAEHEAAAARVDYELSIGDTTETMIIDGGPHTFWWSSQDHSGQATGNAPIPQLLSAMIPTAKLVITLAEPTRRAYSDYWFLTATGVAKKKNHKGGEVQSAADFDAKLQFDADAMDRCFDHSSVQSCAYDTRHFARNGRGRIAIGLYAAFYESWLASFPKEQLLVLRLEDRETADGMAETMSKLLGFLELEPSRKFAVRVSQDARRNINSRKHEPMWPETRRRLRAFYAPHNARLAQILNDQTFLWIIENNATLLEEPLTLPDEEHEEEEEQEVPSARKGELLSLVAKGDVEAVRKSLEEPYDPALPSMLLQMAALRLDPEMTQFLLTLPIIEEEEEKKFAPLHCACLAASWGDSMRGSLIFSLLFGRDSVVDDAIRLGGSDVGLELLAMRGSEPSYGAADVRISLEAAVRETVRVLLASPKTAVDARDDQGRTALHHCAKGGFEWASRLLIDSGASLDPREDVHKATPMHLAAISGTPTTLLALLEAGADTELTNVHGDTLKELVTGRGSPIGLVLALSNDGEGSYLGEHSLVIRKLRDRLEALYGPLDFFKEQSRAWESSDKGGWVAANNLKEAVDVVGDPALLTKCDFEVLEAADADADTLFTSFIARGRPVLIRGLVDETRWPRAHKAFAREEFLNAHGNAPVTVSAIPYAKKFGSASGARERTLRAFVKELDANANATERYPWYVFKGHPVGKTKSKLGHEDWLVDPGDTPVPMSIYTAFKRGQRYSSSMRSSFVEEDDDDKPPAPVDRLEPFINVQLAIGGTGSGAPVHFHNTAWNALLFGSKVWMTYPPAYNLMSNLQIRKWDEERRTNTSAYLAPSLNILRPATCVQHAGDVVIVPELWGHGVLNLGQTIAVATEVKHSMFRNKLPKAWGQLVVSTSTPQPSSQKTSATHDSSGKKKVHQTPEDAHLKKLLRGEHEQHPRGKPPPR